MSKNSASDKKKSRRRSLMSCLVSPFHKTCNSPNLLAKSRRSPVVLSLILASVIQDFLLFRQKDISALFMVKKMRKSLFFLQRLRLSKLLSYIGYSWAWERPRRFCTSLLVACTFCSPRTNTFMLFFKDAGKGKPCCLTCQELHSAAGIQHIVVLAWVWCWWVLTL